MFFICSKRGDTADVWAWIEWVYCMRCIYATWRMSLRIRAVYMLHEALSRPVCCACFFVWRQSVLLYLFTHVDKESIISQQIKRNRWLLLMLCVELCSHTTWRCERCTWTLHWSCAMEPWIVGIWLSLECIAIIINFRAIAHEFGGVDLHIL